MAQPNSINNQNWRDEGYLFRQIGKVWYKKGFLPNGRFNDYFDLTGKLEELAKLIIAKKEYELMPTYASFVAKAKPSDFGEDKTEGFKKLYSETVAVLYTMVCGIQQKLLVGCANGQPLWTDLPDWVFSLARGRGTGGKYEMLPHIYILFDIMPFLSGDSRQQAFDKLLIPPAERWTDYAHLDNFHMGLADRSIALSLDFEGSVPEDFYSSLLADIELERRYTLTPSRPVLVKLTDHPLVNQVYMAQKGPLVIARIQYQGAGDSIEVINLANGDYFGETLYAKAALVEREMAEEEIMHNWALPALLATLYKDLVTAEEIDQPRSAKKRLYRVKEETSEAECDEHMHVLPAPKPLHWRYIPRRIYTRQQDSEALADREPVTEEIRRRQRTLSRLVEVIGHPRTFRDRPNFKPDPERVQDALLSKVQLRPGQTWVRPHRRGQEKLEEELVALGNLEEAIPHYLLRPRKKKATKGVL